MTSYWIMRDGCELQHDGDGNSAALVDRAGVKYIWVAVSRWNEKKRQKDIVNEEIVTTGSFIKICYSSQTSSK